MSASIENKLQYCSGCRNNFYNGNNGIGVNMCWSLKKAKIVRRWRLGWWTRPESESCFTACTTLSCHHAPGRYAMMERLPQHLGGKLPPKAKKTAADVIADKRARIGKLVGEIAAIESTSSQR